MAGQTLKVDFTVGAFPIGFRGNCQDFANALVERLTGSVPIGAIFQAQYGGPQPSTDVGPWWQNGTDLYVFDYSVGSYQPMEDQMPIGGCILWGGPGAPARYLLCQGQQVSRTQYSRLFQRVGTQWGAGDGANTFNLPPGGRYIKTAGWDPVSGLTYYNGQTGGSASVTLAGRNLPPMIVMVHSISGGQGGTGAGSLISGSFTDPTIGFWWVRTLDDNAERSGAAQPVTLPDPSYQCMNLCIRYV